MTTKRGSSGLSFVVGIDKPYGLTSHDVVNECRRVFDERRIGHTGTLDPMATGVLPICVGPATRLDKYLVGHDKTYRVRIAFGASTDTCDALGQVVERGAIPDSVRNAATARMVLSQFVGNIKQMPPVYSAIKVGGKKACDEIRAGREVTLDFRDVSIYEAELLDIDFDEENGYVVWDVGFSVSSGTYIRSLARDIGLVVGCPAHITALRRISVGTLAIDECVSLDRLKSFRNGFQIDPVLLLDFRIAYIKDSLKVRLANGNSFSKNELELYTMNQSTYEQRLSSCSSQIRASSQAPYDGEYICLISDGLLSAIYQYDVSRNMFCARTVFAQGVSRG